MLPEAGEIARIVGATGFGAGVLKLAQIFLEKRAGAPSKAKDASDLIDATAAFQIALNAAAQGIVADLRATVTRLEAEVDDLKRENELCRRESEMLLQRDRERAQQFSSLTSILRRKGIDLTPDGLEGSLIRLDGDQAEVIIPGPKESA